MILNSTRRSSASTALSVPLPTMFCAKAHAAAVLVRLPSSADFGGQPLLDEVGALQRQRVVDLLRAGLLVWPTTFMQTLAAVPSLAIWRSHMP